MADYWKSNPRKFCDFCKCWFADNKASREFHERGKRHKENVEKKIAELTKKGQKQHETQQEVSGLLKQMEEGALRAFKKDVSSNPDLIPQYKVALVEKRVREAEELPTALSGNRYDPSAAAPDTSSAITSQPGTATPEWIEGVSPEGDTYYWNTVTGVSQWDKPENFKAAGEETEKKESDSKEKSATDSATSSHSSSTKSQHDWIEAVGPNGHKYYWNTVTGATQWDKPENFIPEDKGAKPKKESTDKKEGEGTSSEDEDEEKPASRGVKRRGDAYGGWTTIQTEETPDLELPEANPMYASMYRPQAAQFEPREKLLFKEKTVGSIGGGRDSSSGGGVSFKKRKAGGRQIRSRDATS